MSAVTETSYEVRNVKVVRELSDETTCFAASLYCGERRIGTAENRGQGGPTDWHVEDRAEAAAFEQHARGWAEGEGLTFEPVESFIDSLLDDHDNRKVARRNAKKGLPVSALLRVGDDAQAAEFYVCSDRTRDGIQRQAAKMGGTVRRWYDQSQP